MMERKLQQAANALPEHKSDFLAVEESGEKHDGPSEDLRSHDGGYRVDGWGRAYDGLQELRSEMAEEVTEDIRDDHARGRIFDAYPFLHAYQQDHGHGQHRKQQLVIDAS